MNRVVDLKAEINADIGEGWDDEALAPWLDSCNIACGGHAGDDASMLAALRLAARFKIQVGAHPSWPDPANFGRVTMKMEKAAFLESMRQQIDQIAKIAAHEGMKLHHIKAHGALYHDTVERTEIAAWFAAAVQDAARRAEHELAIVTMHDGELAAACARWGIRVIREAYADRGYLKTKDGKFRLIPRSSDGALITDPEAAARQAAHLIELMPVDSICVHSDTQGAALVLQAVATKFMKNRK